MLSAAERCVHTSRRTEGFAVKNPRVTLTADEIKFANAIAFPVADEKSNPLDDVLKFMKFSDEDIKTIDAIKDGIMTLASTLNWAIAAVNTIKGVLTLLGVFDPAKDNTLLALQAMGQRLEQIYGYLAQTAKNTEYQQAASWRTDFGGLRNAVKNLAISRSPLNLSQARQQAADLQKSLLEMLAIPFGTIPFQRAAYDYQPVTSPTMIPPHWIDYAVPFFMTQYDGTPVNYGDPHQELQASIWDPGYYLDVLVQSLELRILALSATEPAFRSTGLDRDDLVQLYQALDTFIATWQNTMLRTRVIGPIDPGLTVGGPTGLAHSLHGVYYSQVSIPVAVVDPVSGISALEPTFSDGFDLAWVPYANPPDEGYWVLTNYDAAVASAGNRIYELHKRVLARCGIDTLQAIKDAIGDMIMGPMGSEFVEFSPVSFHAGTLQKGANENVSLGFIGQYSSHPNKTYTGTRYTEYGTGKSFKIPLARRADVSQVQIGYTLGISFADDQPELQLVLCPFGAAAPNAPAPPSFPTEAIQQTLQSDNTTVYDVYQSAAFSIDQEDQWENNGYVSGPAVKLGYKAYSPYVPQRLFVNPRKGKIRAQISITFDPGDQSPDAAFVGYANVTVSNLSPDQYRDGFTISISAYETIVGTTGIGNPNVNMTKLADSVTLHFVPTFLVLGDDYFADRKEGLQRLGQMFAGMNERYVHYAAPGPVPDPLSKIADTIRQEEALIGAVQAFRREDPEEEALMRARFQPPTVQTEKGVIDTQTVPQPAQP
jgi:hypothetical protein